MEKLKEKMREFVYNFKQGLFFLLTPPSYHAKQTDPEIELKEVIGLPLGSVFDFELDRKYNLYYNKKHNLIISISTTKSKDYILINFYGGLKVFSDIEYVEAFQIFKHFSESLNISNNILPVIKTEKGFYSFVKINTQEFIHYPNQEKYLQTFRHLSEDAKLDFKNLIHSFSDQFRISEFEANDYLYFLYPRQLLDKGRVFRTRKKDNLVIEVKNLLSPLGFEPSYFITINNNLILGKASIDGRNVLIGAYVSNIQKPNGKIRKRVFEIKLLSILKFTVTANEEELQISKKYNIAGNFGTIKQNTENPYKPKNTAIDKEHLENILMAIKSFIETRARNIAHIEVLRETVPNASTKYRFSFHIIIRELKNIGSEDGKNYAINYLRAIQRVSKIIQLAITRYENQNLIQKEMVEGLGVEDSFFSGFDDALQIIKKFEYYAGAFSTAKNKEEI